jgi:hypothetical protein
MSTAHDEADARKNVSPGGHAARIDVRVDVVDRDERHLERQGQRLGRADADQQRPDQARPVVNGDRSDLTDRDSGGL